MSFHTGCGLSGQQVGRIRNTGVVHLFESVQEAYNLATVRINTRC